MRKLSLDLDGLRIDSFVTGSGADQRGTVRGRETRVTEFCSRFNHCPLTTGDTTTGTAVYRDDDAQPAPRQEPQLPE